jgi:triphosphoribosyl-dephospho-CoA synthase
MTGQASAPAIAAAFIRACTLDVTTLKPGNVSEASPGHRMTAAQFIASAEAAAPLLCRPDARVGARIRGAVEASLNVANCNTNLGIILLCAPIAAAAEGPPESAASGHAGESRETGESGMAGSAHFLQRRVREVIHSLTVADADDAFRAIALASPAGLGTIAEHDVREAAAIDLRAAMVLAAGRDLIARQYANDCSDLFGIGLPAWEKEYALQLGDQLQPQSEPGTENELRLDKQERAARCAMQRVYLEFLARFADSHILRKHGAPAARAVSRQARTRLRGRFPSGAAAQSDLAEWDAQLKAKGINPGSSADLAVACAFLAEIVRSPFILAHSRTGWQYS